MKKIILTAVALIAVSQVASAAFVQVDEAPSGTGGTIFSLTLFSEAGDGPFGAFAVRNYATAPSTFQNVAVGGLTDVKATDKSFINAFLSAPTLFGGYGLTIAASTNTETEQTVDAALLGADINAQSGIFLGNLVLPQDGAGSYLVELKKAGATVASLAGNLGAAGPNVPEPATLAMASVGLIGLVLRRRNG